MKVICFVFRSLNCALTIVEGTPARKKIKQVCFFARLIVLWHANLCSPDNLKKTKKRFFILSFFQQFVILCLIHVDNTHIKI